MPISWPTIEKKQLCLADASTSASLTASHNPTRFVQDISGNEWVYKEIANPQLAKVEVFGALLCSYYAPEQIPATRLVMDGGSIVGVASAKIKNCQSLLHYSTAGLNPDKIRALVKGGFGKVLTLSYLFKNNDFHQDNVLVCSANGRTFVYLIDYDTFFYTVISHSATFLKRREEDFLKSWRLNVKSEDIAAFPILGPLTNFAYWPTQSNPLDSLLACFSTESSRAKSLTHGFQQVQAEAYARYFKTTDDRDSSYFTFLHHVLTDDEIIRDLIKAVFIDFDELLPIEIYDSICAEKKALEKELLKTNHFVEWWMCVTPEAMGEFQQTMMDCYLQFHVMSSTEVKEYIRARYLPLFYKLILVRIKSILSEIGSLSKDYENEDSSADFSRNVMSGFLGVVKQLAEINDSLLECKKTFSWELVEIFCAQVNIVLEQAKASASRFSRSADGVTLITQNMASLVYVMRRDSALFDKDIALDRQPVPRAEIKIKSKNVEHKKVVRDLIYQVTLTESQRFELHPPLTHKEKIKRIFRNARDEYGESLSSSFSRFLTTPLPIPFEKYRQQIDKAENEDAMIEALSWVGCQASHEYEHKFQLIFMKRLLAGLLFESSDGHGFDFSQQYAEMSVRFVDADYEKILSEYGSFNQPVSTDADEQFIFVDVVKSSSVFHASSLQAPAEDDWRDWKAAGEKTDYVSYSEYRAQRDAHQPAWLVRKFHHLSHFNLESQLLQFAGLCYSSHFPTVTVICKDRLSAVKEYEGTAWEVMHPLFSIQHIVATYPHDFLIEKGMVEILALSFFMNLFSLPDCLQVTESDIKIVRFNLNDFDANLTKEKFDALSPFSTVTESNPIRVVREKCSNPLDFDKKLLFCFLELVLLPDEIHAPLFVSHKKMLRSFLVDSPWLTVIFERLSSEEIFSSFKKFFQRVETKEQFQDVKTRFGIINNYFNFLIAFYVSFFKRNVAPLSHLIEEQLDAFRSEEERSGGIKNFSLLLLSVRKTLHGVSDALEKREGKWECLKLAFLRLQAVSHTMKSFFQRTGVEKSEIAEFFGKIDQLCALLKLNYALHADLMGCHAGDPSRNIHSALEVRSTVLAPLADFTVNSDFCHRFIVWLQKIFEESSCAQSHVNKKIMLQLYQRTKEALQPMPAKPSTSSSRMLSADVSRFGEVLRSANSGKELAKAFLDLVSLTDPLSLPFVKLFFQKLLNQLFREFWIDGYFESLSAEKHFGELILFLERDSFTVADGQVDVFFASVKPMLSAVLSSGQCASASGLTQLSQLALSGVSSFFSAATVDNMSAAADAVWSLFGSKK